MDFSRFITLLLKDSNGMLTREEFLEFHEMLQMLYAEYPNTDRNKQ